MALFKILKGESSRISTDTTPFNEGYAYFTPDDGGFYIDAKVSDANKRIRINPKARESKSINATLSGEGWIEQSQTVTVTGVTANSNGCIGVASTIDSAALKAATAAKLIITGQGENTITVKATGTVPTVDIPVTVVVME